MTANIDPIEPAAPLPVEAAGRTAKTAQGSGAFAAALDAARQTTAAEALPPVPPPELAAHIAAAARAWEALSASGRHVSFTETAGGRPQIELAGEDGNTTLSAGELFALIDREGGA